MPEERILNPDVLVETDVIMQESNGLVTINETESLTSVEENERNGPPPETPEIPQRNVLLLVDLETSRLVALTFGEVKAATAVRLSWPV